MSVVTNRPTPTTTVDGVTGAANAAAALSDDTDTSYVTITGQVSATQVVEVVMGDISLPAGSVVKDVTLRVRAAKATGTGTSVLAFSAGPPPTPVRDTDL